MWLVDFITWQLYSGMRLSETLNIRMSDIDLNTWELGIGNRHFVTKSKTKQLLPIGLIPQLTQIVQRKMSEGLLGDDRLFSHVCRRQTHRLFKKYLRAGLPNKQHLNIHSLRHTCCINLLRAGVPIYAVQRWLRHADVKTTQGYADLLSIDISTQVGDGFKKLHGF